MYWVLVPLYIPGPCLFFVYASNSLRISVLQQSCAGSAGRIGVGTDTPAFYLPSSDSHEHTPTLIGLTSLLFDPKAPVPPTFQLVLPATEPPSAQQEMAIWQSFLPSPFDILSTKECSQESPTVPSMSASMFLISIRSHKASV